MINRSTQQPASRPGREVQGLSWFSLNFSVDELDRAWATSRTSEWIEVISNGQRPHSTLGRVTPAVFEQQYYDNLNSALAA